MKNKIKINKPKENQIIYKYGGNDFNGYETKIIEKKTNHIWKWITIVATVLGLITGSIALYDYLTEDEYTIRYEQRLSPGQKATLDNGQPVEKGITITPKEENNGPSNSTND